MSKRKLPLKTASDSEAPQQRPRVAARDREQNTRLFAFVLLNFLARADQLRRGHFEQDIDLAVIAEAVAVAAIDPRMRDPEFVKEFKSMDSVVGAERQRSVNALSISAATGIPRETTRRKIKHLVDLGVLAETERGRYVLKPGYVQGAPMKRLWEELTRESVRFVNECFDQNLIQVVSNPDPRG